MCGIAGLLALNGQAVDPVLLQRMSDRLTHRGPDGEGFLLVTAESGNFRHTVLPRVDLWDRTIPVTVGLAHRRLAILDLSERGNQPMVGGDGRAWIVFNGEIYNHIELRSGMEAAGRQFKTRTDTEVLLNAYLEWGDGCVDRVEGMFAFAIWDGVKGRLFCARDRLGIKPFYYASSKKHFVFASEIKAILACPEITAKADDEAVMGFLVHSNCDYGERTMFREIKALPGGHILTVDAVGGVASVRQYWDLRPRLNYEPSNDNDQIEQLKQLLINVTRRHLISDVQAGSCLSGGLDSSTVVGLIGKIAEEEPGSAGAIGDRLNTFTSCYADPRYDERQYALAVAQAAGAIPHLVFPNPKEFWADFRRMAWHQDMPFGTLSYFAQWSVMRAARQAGVKVLLDGQGGDEVFGGYAKVRYAYLASLLRSGRLVKMARELAGTVSQGDRYVLDLRNGYRYLPGALRKVFNVDSALRQVLRLDWADAISNESTPATRWWRYASTPRNGHSGWSLCQQIQVDDIVVDTLPQLLRMEDRSSMAFSLEARVPFLDHHLVEFGLSLPDTLKIRKGWSKFAVREAMRGMMPESVRLRKTKLGFAAPDRQWMASDLRSEIKDFIGGDLRCSAYIDPESLRRWYSSPESIQANTESHLGLFRILSLEMWMQAYSL